ncbi:putative GPI-anchored adhesin-like protein PGA55 [Platysternon megacephalum]|uniref:Putative GPI-anchored adhesin-like protein PGA55 n=1 Tax=Platysternon megacephalum TaxID=55544 RepID=A0A4D9EZR1_9SAUR|nr:putative GPI-anchored adhesin-like protein PGA55 [Platysternon megacephalum]
MAEVGSGPFHTHPCIGYLIMWVAAWGRYSLLRAATPASMLQGIYATLSIEVAQRTSPWSKGNPGVKICILGCSLHFCSGLMGKPCFTPKELKESVKVFQIESDANICEIYVPVPGRQCLKLHKIEQADLIVPSVIQQGKYVHLMLLGYQPYLQIEVSRAETFEKLCEQK